MHYTNVLSEFKYKYKAYVDRKTKDDPDFPKVNDRDSDRKIMK